MKYGQGAILIFVLHLNVIFNRFQDSIKHNIKTERQLNLMLLYTLYIKYELALSFLFVHTYNLYLHV